MNVYFYYNFAIDCTCKLKEIMNRQKPVFYSNKYERKNVVEFSIKMPVKRHEPLSKKLLQGQSSAHTSKRKQIP